MSRLPLVLLVLSGALLSGPAWAEAPENRWYFGGSVSYVSFEDEIRNNAHIIHTRQFGDDGIPFTGDPNELGACGVNQGFLYPEQDPFCDPRPDDLLARDATIDPGLGFGLAVGYRFTQRFALRLDYGYSSGEVGPIDIYQTETIPIKDRFGLPSALMDQSRSTPMPAGDLTTMPISISGVLSLAPKKPFRPYFAGGVGLVRTTLDVNEDLEEVRSRISAVRMRGFSNEYGRDLSDPIWNGTMVKEDGQIPFEMPLEVSVEDGHEWHLSAGLEYFFNSRFSIVFDATYLVVDQEVEIDFDGEDQIDVLYWPEAIYRADGSLEIYSPAATAPNPSCGRPVNEFAYGCYNKQTSDRVNPEGQYRDPQDSTNILTGPKCPAFGDFNRDGKLDSCYGSSFMSPSGVARPLGFWVVQGGDLDLTALTATIGLRLHF